MSPSPHSTIALLQSRSLSAVVQEEIERAILVGDYLPGAKLNEIALAERLGVSRGPIREAFRMLDEAGLVRTEKNRGVFVRDIPLDEAIEIFDLRAAMEELVGRQLAGRITAPELQEMRERVSAMDDAVQAQDARQYHLLNLQFHDRLVELAGNRKLTALYRKLIKELSLFRRLNLADSEQLPVSAGEHEQIVQAIASGDTQRAGQALFNHAMVSKARTIANASQRAPQAAAAPAAPAAMHTHTPPKP
jgi:phosphonate utilization transcriptional regulator